MGSRVDLHILLESLLGSDHVYFQPPSTALIAYPCIVYQRSFIKTKFADNNPYCSQKEYTITVIDKNPDSAIPDKISKLQTASFDRHYTADGLNHDVFTLFF